MGTPSTLITIRKRKWNTPRSCSATELLKKTKNYRYYESIKRELKRRLIHEYRCDERLKTKTEESTHLRHWVGRGTGTPKDKDEVNKREVCKTTGASSTLAVELLGCLLLIDKARGKNKPYMSVGTMKD
jgi:hypothetical protein